MSPAPKALACSGSKAIKIVRKRPGVNEDIWKRRDMTVGVQARLVL